MIQKGSLIFLKLCTLKVHVKLIFLNSENCDVTTFNYEKNRFLCRNFGNFGSKPQAMRGLFLGIFGSKTQAGRDLFLWISAWKHRRGEAYFSWSWGFQKFLLKGFLLWTLPPVIFEIYRNLVLRDFICKIDSPPPHSNLHTHTHPISHTPPPPTPKHPRLNENN